MCKRTLRGHLTAWKEKMLQRMQQQQQQQHWSFVHDWLSDHHGDHQMVCGQVIVQSCVLVMLQQELASMNFFCSGWTEWTSLMIEKELQVLVQVQQLMLIEVEEVTHPLDHHLFHLHHHLVWHPSEYQLVVHIVAMLKMWKLQSEVTWRMKQQRGMLQYWKLD